MNDRLKAALQYEAQGWSVIPIRPGSKLPAVQWAEFQRRRATANEITAWWDRWPDANIGIVTGAISGIIAVDVDPKHGGQASPIQKSNPTQLVQKTGSGGFHLLYAYPGGVDWVPNRANVQPGVDIRADGGYILVAPSETDVGPYTWVATKGASDSPPRWAVVPDDGERDTKADRWLADAMKGVDEGQRNDTMARIVGYLASKDVPRDVAQSFVKVWNKSNENPHTLSATEIEATVTSVYRTHSRRRKRREQIQLGTTNQTLSTDKKLSIETWAKYAAKHGDRAVEWTIQDWLPRSTIAFIVSPPGTYKTWVMLDAAISIASGSPFLGKWKVDGTGPVVLFQQEDHHAAIVERVGAIVWSKFDLSYGEFSAPRPPDIPLYIHPDRGLRFDDPEVVASFVYTIRKLKPVLVIIDPLYTAVSSDNYMAEAAERMLVLKALRDEIGTTFMIAHHTRKSASHSDSAVERIDAWGSQFLNAFLETGWQIRPTSDNRVIRVLRHFKAAGTQHEEIGLRWHINDDNLQYGIEEAALPKPKSKVDDRSQAILQALSSEALSTRGVARVLECHPNVAHRLLDRMVNDGVVFRNTDGKWEVAPEMEESIQLTIGGDSSGRA